MRETVWSLSTIGVKKLKISRASMRRMHLLILFVALNVKFRLKYCYYSNFAVNLLLPGYLVESIARKPSPFDLTTEGYISRKTHLILIF